LHHVPDAVAIHVRDRAVCLSSLPAPFRVIILFAVLAVCAFHLFLDPGSGLVPRLGLLCHRKHAELVDPVDAEVMEHIIGVSTGLAMLQ